MPALSTSIRHAATLGLLLVSPGLTLADDPTPPKSEARKAEEAIKPLPPVAIPDDPPPHEGAMIDIPLTIEPPDILVIEVLEALPGRPITGDRLVRPDGTVSLGFYGDIQVRGLTPQQVKVKVIHRLREHISDELLGLILPFKEPLKTLPKPGTIIMLPAPPLEPAESGDPAPDRSEKPKDAKENPINPGGSPAPPSTGLPRLRRPQRRLDRQSGPSTIGRRGAARRVRFSSPAVAAESKQASAPNGVPPGAMPAGHANEEKCIFIDPADSLRVFVDFTSHNSKVYFVQGDVGVPGRLPVTGKETILDALNYAGGLVPTAEPRDIHLYRPAQGGKPARDYPIDLDAIRKGDTRANLQIFPYDRLVIGRNAIVKKTVDLDRVASSITSVFNTILQYSVSARSLASMGLPPSGSTEVKVGGQSVTLPGSDPSVMTAARRDANMKEWVDFLWDLSSQEAGKTLDEKALREAILKRLTTPQATEPRR